MAQPDGVPPQTQAAAAGGALPAAGGWQGTAALFDESQVQLAGWQAQQDGQQQQEPLQVAQAAPAVPGVVPVPAAAATQPQEREQQQHQQQQQQTSARHVQEPSAMLDESQLQLAGLPGVLTLSQPQQHLHEPPQQAEQAAAAAAFREPAAAGKAAAATAPPPQPSLAGTAPFDESQWQLAGALLAGPSQLPASPAAAAAAPASRRPEHNAASSSRHAAAAALQRRNEQALLRQPPGVAMLPKQAMDLVVAAAAAAIALEAGPPPPAAGGDEAAAAVVVAAAGAAEGGVERTTSGGQAVAAVAAVRPRAASSFFSQDSLAAAERAWLHGIQGEPALAGAVRPRQQGGRQEAADEATSAPAAPPSAAARAPSPHASKQPQHQHQQQQQAGSDVSPGLAAQALAIFSQPGTQQLDSADALASLVHSMCPPSEEPARRWRLLQQVAALLRIDLPTAGTAGQQHQHQQQQQQADASPAADDGGVDEGGEPDAKRQRLSPNQQREGATRGGPGEQPLSGQHP
jgi:hypothetical protein